MSIVLEGVTKRYGSLAVVDDVHLEVRDGELFVLLGESGSGKSTMLRLIAGLTRLDRGRILLHGRDVTDLPPQQRGTGLVFQNYSLFQHMTVTQNVEFGLMIRRVNADERRSVRSRLLEMVGLAGLDDRYPAQLSGGQQQRVALARALAYQPDVLLLDEPFGALDAKTRGYLRGELRRIQRELNVTTIFVTHDRDEAFELADRMGVLLRGRLVASGVPRSLYLTPSTPYVAGLIGEANYLLGHVRPDAVEVGELRFPAATADLAVEQGRQALIQFRPEDVEIAPSAEAVTGQPLGGARIAESGFAGSHLKIRLTLDAAVLTPIPRSPVEEATAQTITAVLPGDRQDLLDAGQLWAGLKRYRVLPGDPLRTVAVVGAGEAGRAVLELVRNLANAEAIDVSVRRFLPGTPLRTEGIENWREMEVPASPKRDVQVAPPDAGAVLADLGSLLPDMLVLGKPDAMDLLRTVTARLDHRLRRQSTALVAVAPGEVRLHRILVATAAGAPGREDVRFAARLARRVQAELVLLHVIADRRLPLDVDKLVARRVPQAIHLRQDASLVQSLGIHVTVMLRSGEPAGVILRETDASEAGMLVIGAHLPSAASWRGDLTRRIVELNSRPTAVLYAKLL